MNAMPTVDPNPYDSSHATDPNAASDTRRPPGTFVLAAVFLLGGLWVGGHRFYLATYVFSLGQEVVLHPSYYVAATRDVVTCATALIGAFGLLLGQAFGWWLSIVHAYWRLSIQGVLPLLGVMAAQPGPDSPPQSDTVAAGVWASVIFLLIVLYLQKKNVLSYFRLNVRRAIVNSLVPVLCIGVAFSLDLWWAATLR